MPALRASAFIITHVMLITAFVRGCRFAASTSARSPRPTQAAGAAYPCAPRASLVGLPLMLAFVRRGLAPAAPPARVPPPARAAFAAHPSAPEGAPPRPRLRGSGRRSSALPCVALLLALVVVQSAPLPRSPLRPRPPARLSPRTRPPPRGLPFVRGHAGLAVVPPPCPMVPRCNAPARPRGCRRAPVRPPGGSLPLSRSLSSLLKCLAGLRPRFAPLLFSRCALGSCRPSSGLQ